MPEVWLQQPYSNPGHEEEREQCLDHNHHPPPLLKEILHLTASQPADSDTDDSQERGHAADSPSCVGEKTHARRQPGEIGKEQQRQQTGKSVPAISKSWQ